MNITAEEFAKYMKAATGRILEPNMFEIIDGQAVCIRTDPVSTQSNVIAYELFSEEDLLEYFAPQEQQS